MTNKFLLWGGALALSVAAMASAKSYDVKLYTTMQAGSSQLAPGEYKLQVEGTNATFTAMDTRKSVTVPVKIENANTKYNVTAVDTSQQGNTVQIKSIELGGSKTRLEFSR